MTTQTTVTKDTVSLLKECNAGCKSATNSMEQVLPMIKNSELCQMVDKYNKMHVDFGDECHKLLNAVHEDERDPHPVAKAASWLSTEVKLAFRSDTPSIAVLLYDGCNMGIRSLLQYLHQYKDASEECKHLARRIIGAEEDFRDELSQYL